MEKKCNYLLKFHPFYYEKIEALKVEIKRIQATHDPESFRQHPQVKFAARLRKATTVIILCLYLSDRHSQRKEGDKNDPYQFFTKYVKQGKGSADPQDPKIQKWMRENA